MTFLKIQKNDLPVTRILQYPMLKLPIILQSPIPKNKMIIENNWQVPNSIMKSEKLVLLRLLDFFFLYRDIFNISNILQLVT